MLWQGSCSRDPARWCICGRISLSGDRITRATVNVLCQHSGVEGPLPLMSISVMYEYSVSLELLPLADCVSDKKTQPLWRDDTSQISPAGADGYRGLLWTVWGCTKSRFQQPSPLIKTRPLLYRWWLQQTSDLGSHAQVNPEILDDPSLMQSIVRVLLPQDQTSVVAMEERQQDALGPSRSQSRPNLG